MTRVPAAVASFLLLFVPLFATGIETDFSNGETCFVKEADADGPCAKPLRKQGPTPELVDSSNAPAPRCGAHALRFHLDYAPEGGRAVRSEILLRPKDELRRAFPRTDRGDYAFSLYFPEDYAADSEPEIVAQWHFWEDYLRPGVKMTGSPQASLEIARDTLFARLLHNGTPVDPDAPADENGEVSYRPDKKELFNLGALPKGRWIDFRVQARWTPKPEGAVRLWMDDSLVVDYRGPTAYVQVLKGDPPPYFKVGVYKWPWKKPGLERRPGAVLGRTLFLDRLQVRAGWGGSDWGKGCPDGAKSP